MITLLLHSWNQFPPLGLQDLQGAHRRAPAPPHQKEAAEVVLTSGYTLWPGIVLESPRRNCRALEPPPPDSQREEGAGWTISCVCAFLLLSHTGASPGPTRSAWFTSDGADFRSAPSTLRGRRAASRRLILTSSEEFNKPHLWHPPGISSGRVIYALSYFKSFAVLQLQTETTNYNQRNTKLIKWQLKPMVVLNRTMIHRELKLQHPPAFLFKTQSLFGTWYCDVSNLKARSGFFILIVSSLRDNIFNIFNHLKLPKQSVRDVFPVMFKKNCTKSKKN